MGGGSVAAVVDQVADWLDKLLDAGYADRDGPDAWVCRARGSAAWIGVRLGDFAQSQESIRDLQDQMEQSQTDAHLLWEHVAEHQQRAVSVRHSLTSDHPAQSADRRNHDQTSDADVVRHVLGLARNQRLPQRTDDFLAA